MKVKTPKRQNPEPEPKVDVVAVANNENAARAVVAKAFPNAHGLDRRIAFLFPHGKSHFFRVNFHDPENQNFIRRSHFVEVAGQEAKEWPNPVPKPRGFDYEHLN